jgi:hypothetical protein
MPGPGTWQPGDILTADDLNAIGVWATYTPVLAQSGSRSVTVNQAKFVQINKMCIANIDLTCTTTGSGGSLITVSMPVAFGGSSNTVMGSGFFYDSSVTNNILVSVLSEAGSPPTFKFRADATSSDLNTAVGNDDVLSFTVVYETS